MSFVHLHTKSEYTLLGSTVRTKELLAKTADLAADFNLSLLDGIN